MLKTKFEYSPILRLNTASGRLYQTPSGSKVPSVTTILDKTKPPEAIKALQDWKMRVGEQKAREITTEAAGRGTRMHKFLEDYLKTGVLNDPGSNPYSQQSHRMARAVIDQGLCSVDEAWGMEIPLYFDNVYAGTTDCIGVYKGKPAIIDFKQSNKPKRREWIQDYFLQMCAYAEAHNQTYGTDIKTGVVQMCVAPKDDEEPVFLEFVAEFDEFEAHRISWWKRVEEYYLKFA